LSFKVVTLNCHTAETEKVELYFELLLLSTRQCIIILWLQTFFCFYWRSGKKIKYNIEER